jgi:hypothetical protein
MRSATLRVVYAHDDNLGSHAHYELLDEPPAGCDTDWAADQYGERLWLYRGRSDRPPEPWWKPDCYLVQSALIPKPTKVRLSIDELFKIAGHLREAFNLLFDEDDIWFELAFSTGVEYRQRLLGMRFDPRETVRFDLRCAFPRHVAIVSVYRGEAHLCDLLLDATAVDLNPDSGSLLAIVAPGIPKHSLAWRDLESLSDAGEQPLPVIVAPPTPRA